MDALLVEFVRGKDNRVIGAMVATGRYEVGWSLCAKADRKFGTVVNKDRAVEIAYGRALAKANPKNIPISLSKSYAKMMERSSKYFK